MTLTGPEQRARDQYMQAYDLLIDAMSINRNLEHQGTQFHRGRDATDKAQQIHDTTLISLLRLLAIDPTGFLAVRKDAFMMKRINEDHTQRNEQEYVWIELHLLWYGEVWGERYYADDGYYDDEYDDSEWYDDVYHDDDTAPNVAQWWYDLQCSHPAIFKMRPHTMRKTRQRHASGKRSYRLISDGTIPF